VVKTAGVGEAGIAFPPLDKRSAGFFATKELKADKPSALNRLRAYRRNDIFAETK
jgi:hypothetical protein